MDPPALDPLARRLTGDPPRALPGDEPFDWGDDRPPRTPWERTVLYECHVRGATMRHPDVPHADRGTYRGLVAPAFLDHLLGLGVTAVQLMPVQHALTEPRLRARGLTNYWGYNPIGWFAPDERFATAPGRQLREFREMVRGLHSAGLEVVLDVVFNHTAEQGADGPALTWKRLDPAVYRRDERGGYVDWTGCGNTVDFRQPRVRAVVLDCLLYWVQELRVDGFRFDLAPILGRDCDFLEVLAAEPRLRGVKLIAEPWDLGPDGYRLGRFPPGWVEWNDRFRDAVRRFWRGDVHTAPELASRLAGSADLLRSPCAGVNYVACHDGFTLRDLVSYDRKHNAANGEGGRDGTDANHGRRWPERLRGRLQRAMLATVALSRGVPMIGHGDELGRTQRGNNNAYCHDSELTWIDWELADVELLEFARRALQARQRLAVLRRDAPYDPACARWLDPDGAVLTHQAWHRPDLHAFGLLLEDRVLLLLNAAATAETFNLPGERWEPLLESAPHAPAGGCRLAAHSIALLVRA